MWYPFRERPARFCEEGCAIGRASRASGHKGDQGEEEGRYGEKMVASGRG